MSAIQNFAFEEHLVRIVERGGDPWFVGKDVCHCLGIGKHHQALETLDEDERGTCIVGTPRGKQGMIAVSEPGVYRLVFRSRKPEAERFKRWLAHEVLPQIRRTGSYSSDATAPLPDLSPDAPLAARVDAVRLASRLWGHDRARSLWSRLGLPAVPPPLAGEGGTDARACLAVLLAHDPASDGRTVRSLILEAIDDDVDAELTLRAAGVRVSEDGESFLVANVSPALEAIYRGTEWQRRKWRLALRRLRGTNPHGTTRFTAQGKQARATLLPLTLIDELSS